MQVLFKWRSLRDRRFLMIAKMNLSSLARRGVVFNNLFIQLFFYLGMIFCKCRQQSINWTYMFSLSFACSNLAYSNVLEKDGMNRVRSMLSTRGMLLGYSFEPRSSSRVPATAGSIMTIGLSINGCSHSKKPVWPERTRLASPEVWAAATFRTQEDKRRLCSRAGWYVAFPRAGWFFHSILCSG